MINNIFLDNLNSFIYIHSKVPMIYFYYETKLKKKIK
jgi:hypothetical protein